jgi:hypothetical protein
VLGFEGTGVGVRVSTSLELTGFPTGSFPDGASGEAGHASDVVSPPTEELAGVTLFSEAESLVAELALVADEAIRGSTRPSVIGREVAAVCACVGVCFVEEVEFVGAASS